jgi:glycosyltransferase involved in cell wall biosynthesis
MAAGLRISVIIPTLNQGRFIEQAINSVLTQENVNVELIVVDGGSSDDTIEIINKYRSRLAVCISEKDEGQTDAINKGFAHCTGDIVTWLNSDDFYEPGALKIVSEVFSASSPPDLLHGRAKLFGAGKKIKVIGPSATLHNWEYLSYMRFPQPASFFSRIAVQPFFPLDKKLHYGMDFDLVARMVLAGGVVQGVPAIFSSYRLHENSKTHEHEKFLNDWTMVFCGVLESLGADHFLEELKSAGIQLPVKKLKYYREITLTPPETEQMFLEHLHILFHTHYKLANKLQCRRIAHYLKEKYPSRYNDGKYKVYLNRLKFAPSSFIRLFQKLRR